MAAVEDVAAYLDACGHGTVGTDIMRHGFLGDFDDEAGTYDNLILVTQPGGMPAVQAFAAKVSDRPSVQVFVRNTDMTTAQAKADAVYDDLDGLATTTLGSNTYLLVTADSPPVELGRDGNRRAIWVVGFSLMKRN